jgi:RES domain-containing protein
MAVLPGALCPNEPLLAWRVDTHTFASTWNSGIGAELAGGRWNSKGVRAVYCALDPATCLLEAAVHKGFHVLDTVAHVLTGLEIHDPARVKIVTPAAVNSHNPAWLHAGSVSAGQQAFGDALLDDPEQPFVVFPSVVSTRSWNLVFRPDLARKLYRRYAQKPLVIDGRLNPPV